MRTHNSSFEIIRQLKNPIALNKRNSKDILKIDAKSFLEFDNKLFYVDEKITYEEKKGSKVVDTWNEFELISLQENAKVCFLEIEEDDGINLYFTENLLKLRELNIKKSDISSIISNESSVFLNGSEFYYEDDYTAYIKGKNEIVKIVEFESDYATYLTIEQYEDGETRAYSSKRVNNIEVVSL